MALFCVVLFLFVPKASPQRVTITWTNLVNVAVNGTVLQKTQGCDGCQDAEAISQEQLSADGYVEFAVGELNTLWMAGLSHGSDDSTYGDIDFGFRFNGGGYADILEGGTYAGGDTTYAPAPNVNRSFTVRLAVQAITFGSLAAKRINDPPFTVSATASSGLPVTFSIASGPATIDGNVVTVTGTGTVTVRASQAGDSTYAPAPNVNRSFSVTLAAQTIVFAPLANKRLVDPPFALSALSSSGLPVAFGIVSGPATIEDDVVTLTGTGTVTIRASQAGDGTYGPAPNVNRSFRVAQ